MNFARKITVIVKTSFISNQDIAELYYYIAFSPSRLHGRMQLRISFQMTLEDHRPIAM